MQSYLGAGQLYQRIKIEEYAETLATSGQPTRTWSTLAGAASLPAMVDQVTGGETLRGRTVSGETSIVFTIRYLSTITNKMRVVYGGTNYGIVRAVDPYGDRRELRIEAKAAD